MPLVIDIQSNNSVLLVVEKEVPMTLTKQQLQLIKAALLSCQRKADYESHRFHVTYWKTFDTELVKDALKVLQ